jgi:hypothetical protein
MSDQKQVVRYAHDDTLPLEPHEGLAPVVVTSEFQVSEIVRGDLRSTILKFALPAVAASLLMTLFASVDAFWVGKKLGPEALAAVSTSLFYIWMAVALGEMVGVGLTAVAARRRGEGRHEEAGRIAGDAIVFSLALGCLVAVAGTFALPSLFQALGTSPSVSALGERYLGTYLVGLPLIFGFFAVDATFRAAGDTRTPLFLLVSSVAVTLVLDPVLILGLGPFPQLGIVGAAIATLTTRGVVFVFGCAIAMRRDQRLPHRIADGGHRRGLQHHLRRHRAHRDTVRDSGAGGVGYWPPRGKLVVHGRGGVWRSDGGDCRAESGSWPPRPRGARWVARGGLLLPSRHRLLCLSDHRAGVAGRHLFDRSGRDP